MIHDQYTNLKVSRQRKWQLRNPLAFKIIKSRYEETDKGRWAVQKYMRDYRSKIESRVYQREYQRDLNWWSRRYLNARSYQDEAKIY